MNYTKPQVAVLGEAVRVIEMIKGAKLVHTTVDAPGFEPNPAYDLDE